jgi:hypothetical protein
MVLEAFHDMCRCASMLANQTSWSSWSPSRQQRTTMIGQWTK